MRNGISPLAGFSGPFAQRAVSVAATITATVAPATSVLVVGQALQDTTNWLTFLDASNYATSAGGATISTVVVNYIGSTATAAEAFIDGETNHFSITVTDSLGNSRTFLTTAHTVVYAAPSAAGGILDQSWTENTGVQTVDVASDFTGSGLTFTLQTAPAGVTIAGSTVSFDTGAMSVQADTTIVVRGTNSGGYADTAFGATITAAAAGYTAKAVDNQGTVYGINNAFTGHTGGKAGTISLWYYCDSASWLANDTILSGQGGGNFTMNLLTLSSGRVKIELFNAAGVKILETRMTSADFVGQAWCHILISWDLNTGTVQGYVNGAPTTDSTTTGPTNEATGNITDMGVFAYPSGVGPIDGYLSDVFIDATYRDISVTATRENFRDETTGKPVDLTGYGTPWLLLTGDETNFFTNQGTGANLAQTGGSLVSVTSPSGEAPAGAASATQGSITFPLDSTYQTGNYVDGPAWVVAPSGLTVTSDPTPAYDGSGGQLTEVNGSQLNPQFYAGADIAANLQSYDGRLRYEYDFDEVLLPTYPLAMSAGDVLVKAKSRLAATAEDRNGLIEEVGVLHVVSSAPDADAFAPTTVGWTGRGTPAATVLNMDTVLANFKATLPVGGYDVSGFTNGPPSFATVQGMIGKFMPLYPQCPGPVFYRGGYDVLGIPNRPNASGTNYGEFVARDIDTAYLYACSSAATDAQIKSILTWLISLGLQWLPAFKGAAQTWGANGAINQFQFLPCMLAEWAQGNTYTDLQAHLPGNQLSQTFKWTTALINSTLVKHTGNSATEDKSYIYRVRNITSVTADTITFTHSTANGDAAQVAFNGLPVYRASDDVLIGTAANLTEGDPATNLTITVTGHGLTTADQFYCQVPYTISNGGYDWLIRQEQSTTGMHTYNPLPLANYRFQQYYGADAIAAILQGGRNAVFENLIGYVNETIDPTSNVFVGLASGPTSTYPGNTPFQIEFLDTYWSTINPDTTAPVINTLSYDDPNLTLDITEASGSSTVVWATSDTNVTPTYTTAGGWAGGARYETGSFTATSGGDTDTITITGTTPDGSRKLTVYAYDAAGNLSAPASTTVTVSNVNDIMAGAGDFASATGWSLDPELAITGGVLVCNTTSTFEKASRNVANRMPCPANTTLDIEFTIARLTSIGRFRLQLRAYDSGGASLQSSVVTYDTNTDPKPSATGTFSKANAYTSPANTATLEVIWEVTTASNFDVDDLKLLY